jgi:hypothetical protein
MILSQVKMSLIRRNFYETLADYFCWIDNSSCKRDIRWLLPSEGKGIAKAAKRFQKQAGGVPLQERSPAA